MIRLRFMCPKCARRSHVDLRDIRPNEPMFAFMANVAVVAMAANHQSRAPRCRPAQFVQIEHILPTPAVA